MCCNRRDSYTINVAPSSGNTGVSSGAVPAGWSFLGQWGGQVPVAQIGATPYGAGPEALAAWLHVGGGLEIVQRGFTPLNVKVLGASWFCHWRFRGLWVSYFLCIRLYIDEFSCLWIDHRIKSKRL